MVAVEAAEDELRPLLNERVGIASINGPRATVLSGDEDAVLELAGRFAAEGRRTRRLRVSHAFHSPRMEPMLAEFRQVVSAVTFRLPELPIVSNATGELATAAQLTSPEYWVEHVRQPVRFADGIRWLDQAGTRYFLETGPDGTLTALGRDCLLTRTPPGTPPCWSRPCAGTGPRMSPWSPRWPGCTPRARRSS